MAGSTNSIVARNVLRGRLSENNLMAGAVGTAYNPTYAIVTEAGAQIVLYINSSNYQFYAELKDKYGNHISNSNIIDLPLESMVVDGSYDAETKEVVLVLDNGNEVRFSVADLVEGLVSTEQLNTILTGYVKFTDYATAVKAGVIKISDTYATTAASGALTSQTKTYEQYNSLNNNAFVGKGTLENVITGKELTNKEYVDTADEVFENDLFGDAEVSDNGENITLNDTLENVLDIELGGNTSQTIIAPVEGSEVIDTSINVSNVDDSKENYITLKGNTYQYSTSGKNLLNLNSFEQYGQNTFTILGDTLTLNGTSMWSRTQQTLTFPANKNYTLMGYVKGTSGAAAGLLISNQSQSYQQYAVNNTGNKVFKYVNFNTNTATELIIQLYGNWSGTSKTTTTVFEKIMIVEGTYTTEQEYEAFTGSTPTQLSPSPNPDYPQDIQVVSGDNEIKVEGKNILDLTSFTTTTQAGITLTPTFENGKLLYISASGTYSSTPYFVLTDTQKIQPNTQYTLTGAYSPSARLRLREYDSNNTNLSEYWDTGSGVSFTSNANVDRINVQVVFYAQNDNAKFYPMLEKGSTATTYQPYQSQTYPINLGVENLLPTSDIISTSGTISNGITFTRNSDGSITANGTATGAISIYINNDYTELSAGTYTFSDSVPSGESGTTFFLYADVRHTDDTSWDTYNFSTATVMTQTIPEGFKFKTRIVVRNGQTLNNVVFKPMIEKGTKANSYTPYGTTPIELCKIGEYQDYIYKDSGKWYKYGAIGKVVLNGSEPYWSVNSSSGFYRAEKVFNILPYTDTNRHIGRFICSHFIPNTSNKIGVIFQYQATLLFYASSGITNVEQWKTWLSTHNTIAYFVLATPTYEEITDITLLSQLNALYTAQIYNEVTNINTEANDLLPYIDLKYNTITASPSPDKPSNIQVVSGDNTIKVEGKNLFDRNTMPLTSGLWISGSNISGNNSGWYVIVPINGGKTYTISKKNSTGYIYTCTTNIYPANNVPVVDGWGGGSGLTTRTITTSSNANYLFIGMYAGATITDEQRNSILEELQIELGNTATSYIPYQSQTYPINLGVENLYEGSQDFSGTWNNSSYWTTDTNRYNGLVVKKRDGQWNGISKDIQVESGKTYTYSLYVKSDSTRPFAIYSSGGTATCTPADKNFTSTTNWQRYSMTFVANSTGTIRLRIENTSSNVGNYTYICGYQLEIGNKMNSYTPYGTTPIELCKIGDYQDKIAKSTGKNLFDKNSAVVLNGYIGTVSNNKGDLIANNYHKSVYVSCEPNTTYTISKMLTSRFAVATYENTPTLDTSTTSNVVFDNSATKLIITSGANDKYMVIWCYGVNTDTSITLQQVLDSIQIEKGNITTPIYEPYGTSWYLNKQIGKVVLDGSSASDFSGSDGSFTYIVDIGMINANIDTLGYLKCNYYQEIQNYKMYDSSVNYGITRYIPTGTYNFAKLVFKNTDINNTNAFATWLSTHNTEVYYVLATPTYTKITDTTLISQLNALEKANSYDEQTNISQMNNDMPFEIAATAFVDSTAGKLAATTAQINTLNETDNDLSANKEDKSNKVATISASSTDIEYPTAKCVYNIIGDIESLLEALDIGSGV